MPTFSVIIPTYNSENFIKNTIKSVLNQTFSDFEVIIVDDGSKDNTRHIINKFKENDSRIKTVITPNSGGPAAPTNIGINLAKGTYIAFLDHDDMWEPHKLETYYTAFKEKEDVGFVLSNVRIHNEKQGTFSFARAEVKNKMLSPETILSGKYFNTFSMLAVKSSTLERIGSVDTNLLIFADYDLIVRMLTYDVPHIFIEEPLVTYRVHQHNTSSFSTSAERRAIDLERITIKYSKRFYMHPKSLSHVYHAIGRIYLGLGDKKKALYFFKKSLQENPTSLAAYVRFFSAHIGEFPYRFFRKVKNETLRNI